MLDPSVLENLHDCIVMTPLLCCRHQYLLMFINWELLLLHDSMVVEHFAVDFGVY